MKFECQLIVNPIIACLVNLDWQSIKNGVAEGLTVALVWAVVVVAYEKWRTFKVRRSIVTALEDRSGVVAVPPDTLGISIKNTSGWPVTIRSISFCLRREVPFEIIECRYLGRKCSEYEGHILLKANTKDAWGVPEKLLTKEIDGIDVEFEFQSTLGRTIVEKIELSAAGINSFRQNLVNQKN